MILRLTQGHSELCRTMKITVINGTNRIENKSLSIAESALAVAKKLGFETSLITLDNFDTLFRGRYIDVGSATQAQKRDIRNMMDADILLFVVPTYHSGIPSPLKNFLDALKCFDCFDGKVITLVAGSDHNQDLGARQTTQVLSGILSYNKARSFVTPRISIVDFNDIDNERLREHLAYAITFYETPHY